MSRMSQASGSILPPLSSLVGPKKVSPANGPGKGEQEESANTGYSSLNSFAKSLQKAEALLWSCMTPSLRRLLQQRANASAYDSEEEDSPGALAHLAEVEQSFLGLSQCLCVQENPRTETFRGHVKPAAIDSAQGAFSYHPVYPSVAKHCATLHALLQHRHHLRLAREYSRRLKGASDFIYNLLGLLAVQQQAPKDWGRDPGGSGHLRGVCEALRMHASHWSGLQRKMRGDPWLRTLLLQRHESVSRMKRALGLLALHAIYLVERYVEVLLLGLARADPTTVLPALLSDFFQGLEIYNHVLSDEALEWASNELGADRAAQPLHNRGVASGARAYSIERVLGLLAAERGRLAAHRLHQLLLQRASRDGLEQVHGEDTVAPLSVDCRKADVGSPEPPTVEGWPSFPDELQALCREDKEVMDLVLGVLVASTDTLWHHVLHRPRQEKPPSEEDQEPPAGPAASPSPAEMLSSSSLPGWKSVRWLDASYSEAAEILYARYRPLFWEAAATSLTHCLELWQDHPQPSKGLRPCIEGAAALLVQDLSQALSHALVPSECKVAWQRLCLHLLLQGVFQSWDRGFCQALGSSLVDKCVPGPQRTAGMAHSRTAQLLQELHPPLAFSLKCLEPPLTASAASSNLVSPALRLELLTRCLATEQASCSWLMTKAYQHLASWSLCLFLLVTQGDLQLLKAEMTQMTELVSGAFPESGDSPTWVRLALSSHHERQLCMQIDSIAASIQAFSQDVLQLFSTDCKRMSAEIFSQTMPLGKHWRAGLRAELPSAPSEYAVAAAQTVLGQVLQGIPMLPQDSQVPALTHVMTAFVEAWMDHILTQKIKFSLQGALQLKQDFDVVRQLVQADCGLSPEIQELVLSLRVFQQMDNAIGCLVQQPSSKANLPSNTWESFRKCCSNGGIRTYDFPASSLNSLESLDVQALRSSPALETPSTDLLSKLQSSCTPESYLTSTQQQWLSLRLHGARRWRVPGLPCTRRSES